jgi:hypothetical protein
MPDAYDANIPLEITPKAAVQNELISVAIRVAAREQR